MNLQLQPQLRLLRSYAPGTNSFYCPAFYVYDTANDVRNYATCQFYACPGASVLLNGCNEYCSTSLGLYLRLYNEDGLQVAEGVDNCDIQYDYCALISYNTTAACQVYELREGCKDDQGCGGMIEVVGAFPAPTPSPTKWPTLEPTYSPDTPTTPPPTAQGGQGACPNYSAADTTYASINYATCQIYACPGSYLAINGCNSYCSGDQYIVLYDQVSLYTGDLSPPLCDCTR